MIKASDLIAKFQYALDNKWGYIWGTAGVLWTNAKQQQKVNYMISNYGKDWKSNSNAKKDNYYNAALYGSKWIGHYVADCSGLFYWAFKQLGGSIYHGSNSIWERYCTEKGELKNGRKENGEELKPGTAVFVHPAGKNRTHIGLYVGNGKIIKVIEASGTQTGVIESDVTHKKWVEWGELKGVEYGDTPTPPDPEWRPTLRKGDSGEWVQKAQGLLMQNGYSLDPYGDDGKFGKVTEEAVKKFQKDHGLDADGVIGKATWDALESISPAKPLFTVSIPHLTEAEAKALVQQYEGASMIEERW